QEVTNAVIDSSQLFFMAQKAKEILGKEQIDVLADMGYYHGAEIKACEEAGMTVYIQKINTPAKTALGLFGKERFVYETPKDCYTCPSGEKMTYHFYNPQMRR